MGILRLILFIVSIINVDADEELLIVAAIIPSEDGSMVAYTVKPGGYAGYTNDAQ